VSASVTDVMPPAVRRVRAYFAAVTRAVGAAASSTIFDPAQNGGFALDAPPSPWVDLGWIDGFARQCGTKVDALRTGTPAAAKMQVRSEIEATVSFRFRSWGKLQLALAAGTQQMNLLKCASGAGAAGSGGAAVAAVAVGAGATATSLPVGSAASGFAVGELVAVDTDYAGATGYVGAGVSGAYLRSTLADVDYLRRVTLNVARVASAGNGVLTLESALPAGMPTSGMKVSGVTGFCDREGSSFFQEWSGVFVAEGQQGERVIWHYPRLQAAAGASESMTAAAGRLETAKLNGVFRALPVVDPVDGETVVCFRSYLPG
jgi:hypothetical protein